VGVAWVVERRAGVSFSRVPRGGINVSGVARAEVLLPHGPPRDYAREIVIEHHTEIGDVFDLPAVVADRAAPRQPTAERVGVLLDRHHRAQTALRSSCLIHKPGGP